MNNELQQLNKSLRLLETMVEEFVANQLEMAKQIDSTRRVIDEVLLEDRMDDEVEHDQHNRLTDEEINRLNQ